eukprot:1157935-Pelagomonas_calceolata.AAC.16
MLNKLTNTADGTSSGAFVGNTDFPVVEDGCLDADDCSVGQFCDVSSNPTIVYRCNPTSGQDENATQGQCSSLCNQPIIRNRLKRLSQTFTEDNVCSDPESGTSTSECPSGQGPKCPSRLASPGLHPHNYMQKFQHGWASLDDAKAGHCHKKYVSFCHAIHLRLNDTNNAIGAHDVAEKCRLT